MAWKSCREVQGRQPTVGVSHDCQRLGLTLRVQHAVHQGCRVVDCACRIPAFALAETGKVEHKRAARVGQTLGDQVPRGAARPNAVDEQDRGAAATSHVQRNAAVVDGDQGH